MVCDPGAPVFRGVVYLIQGVILLNCSEKYECILLQTLFKYSSYLLHYRTWQEVCVEEEDTLSIASCNVQISCDTLGAMTYDIESSQV